MPVLTILYFLEQILMVDTMIFLLQALLLLFDSFSEYNKHLKESPGAYIIYYNSFSSTFISNKTDNNNDIVN